MKVPMKVTQLEAEQEGVSPRTIQRRRKKAGHFQRFEVLADAIVVVQGLNALDFFWSLRVVEGDTFEVWWEDRR